jgi:hypothetical protein
MIKIFRSVLFAVLFFPLTLCFADDLELSAAVPQGSSYAKPFDKTITVTVQPAPFSVILTNRSSSSKSIYWEPDSGYTKSLSFEMTEENGRTFVVKRRKFPTRSAAVVNSFLASGASVTKTLIMDPDEWENLPVIEPGKVKKYRARVIYDNGGHTIYSDYYTLIYDGRG